MRTASVFLPASVSHAGHERQGLDLFEEDVGGADRGDHTEEHEDEDLAETEIAVRLRPPGVGPPGDDRQRTDDKELRADDEREHATEHTCGCERELRSALHRSGRGEP
jgi:hypothetical protein